MEKHITYYQITIPASDITLYVVYKYEMLRIKLYLKSHNIEFIIELLNCTFLVPWLEYKINLPDSDITLYVEHRYELQRIVLYLNANNIEYLAEKLD